MIVRALSADGDFTFGKGKNNYKKDLDALNQSLKTRLQSILGDCFFALTDGIDWFNLQGSKNELELKLAIAATILNTPDVTELLELSVNLSHNTRVITITYEIDTAFGITSNAVDSPVS